MQIRKHLQEEIKELKLKFEQYKINVVYIFINIKCLSIVLFYITIH